MREGFAKFLFQAQILINFVSHILFVTNLFPIHKSRLCFSYFSHTMDFFPSSGMMTLCINPFATLMMTVY